MTAYLTVLIGLLVLILIFGLLRQIVGPTSTDRIIASQLFGTLGTAILILLAVVETQPALINVALVLALLTPLTLIIFFRLRRRKGA